MSASIVQARIRCAVLALEKAEAQVDAVARFLVDVRGAAREYEAVPGIAEQLSELRLALLKLDLSKLRVDPEASHG